MSPVIATILIVAITVVLVGVLYLWVSSLAEPTETEPPVGVTWDIDDVDGAAVNDTAYHNVLVELKLSSSAFDVTKASFRYTNLHTDQFADFIVVDNGTECQTSWIAARNDGSLYDGGWDPTVICLLGSTGPGNGEMGPGEYFHVLEDPVKAPVDDGHGIRITMWWSDASKVSEVDGIAYDG